MSTGVKHASSAAAVTVDQPERLGGRIREGRAEFLVWAPKAKNVELRLVSENDRLVPMTPLAEGYHAATLEGLRPGTRYFYRLDGSDRPDPASRCQPEGVHGPSELLNLPPWEDTPRWQGVPLDDYIVYELHVGTFTPEGTLDAAVGSLDRLHSLGVTAMELMPVAEFPGGRNWGYDGVYPFAVEHDYGGAPALRRFVRACHDRGMAVVLDVVYNHLGPEGNYLRDFGPYFTTRHSTPWGEAVNFDGPQSDEVRRFFLENALYWMDEFGVDALRLDAVHAIHDESAYPFLEELTDVVHACGAERGRALYLIAESDLNDARLVRPKEQGGYGLDAQWADDFHHCLHTLLTGEQSGYYGDFGELEQFAQVYRDGWLYSGQYSTLRERRFGNSPVALGARQFVVCSQNHDQTGNRMLGERLAHLAGWEKAKLAAAAVLLSPFTPLLFMGEEYGEPAPFLYHVSHGDPDLVEAVRAGRRSEFAAFQEAGEPPDPQAVETFLQTKLRQELAESGKHREMHLLYCRMIQLRRTLPAMQSPRDHRRLRVTTDAESRTVMVEYPHDHEPALLILHFGEQDDSVMLPKTTGAWMKVLDSANVAVVSSAVEAAMLQVAASSAVLLTAKYGQ